MANERLQGSLEEPIGVLFFFLKSPGGMGGAGGHPEGPDSDSPQPRDDPSSFCVWLMFTSHNSCPTAESCTAAAARFASLLPDLPLLVLPKRRGRTWKNLVIPRTDPQSLFPVPRTHKSEQNEINPKHSNHTPNRRTLGKVGELENVWAKKISLSSVYTL